MVDELVKYHNDLNSLSMRQWSAEEMDLFFSIVAKIKDNGTDILTLDTNDLKNLASSEQRAYRWNETVEKFTDKAMDLIYKENTPKVLYVSRLFARFKHIKETDELEIKVNDDFEYIVNKLTANFTVYELAEFTSLKSTYSKTMYRILKQWKSLGEKEFKIEQFRELLDIPESYNTGMINKRIIKYIEKELPQYFTGLKVKAIKKNTQGTPVIAYKFTWEKQLSGNRYIPGKYNKKSKPKSLADEDNRMTRKEREEFIRRKMNQPLPFSEDEEIKNIEGQVDIGEL